MLLEKVKDTFLGILIMIVFKICHQNETQNLNTKTSLRR